MVGTRRINRVAGESAVVAVRVSQKVATREPVLLETACRNHDLLTGFPLVVIWGQIE